MARTVCVFRVDFFQRVGGVALDAWRFVTRGLVTAADPYPDASSVFGVTVTYIIMESCLPSVRAVISLQATLRYFRGERYLEVDADLASSLATSQASKQGACTHTRT